ncbi:MAG: SpoIIE family protein phosphatase [Chlorobi bacterium]|nr:SpoIIE family protein phosphatase [Chlorobiota bacterium]
MKSGLISILLAILSPFLFSQNHLIDSLNKQLSSTDNQSKKIDILNSLTGKLLMNNDTNAFFYANEAIRLAGSNQLPLKLCKSYIIRAQCYFSFVKYEKTLKDYFTALEIAEKYKLDSIKFNCFLAIGNTYSFIDEAKKSEEYYLKAMKTGKELHYTSELFAVYNNLALYYEDIDLRKSKEYFLKIITSSNSINKEEYILAMMNLSYLYNLENNRDSAFIILEKTLKEAINIKDTVTIGWCYGFYCHIYYDTQQYNKALCYCDTAMEYLKGAGYYQTKLNDLSLGYELFYKIYTAKKQYKEALENYTKYIAIKDSLFNIEKNRQISEIETKYEVGKKEAENKLLKQKSKTARLIIIAISAISILLVTLAIILFKARQMQKRHNYLLHLKNTQLNQRNEEITAQKEIIERNHQYITESINVASRIQNTILPSIENMAKLFPTHFIFYKPKDIVSGDFYWIATIRGKNYIAAIDCTGHGVPGAFMSIIGNNILNEAVYEKNITSPNQILNYLNLKIHKSLRKKPLNSKRILKAGMDIIIMAFDNEKNELKFAGANHPLLLIRNNEINFFKTDKHDIGENFSDVFKSYNLHNIKLQADDFLYIYSDGFRDQISEKHNRRYMSGNFRQTLLQIHHLPLNEQKEKLENIFLLWKGKNFQTDDLLIIGIKHNIKNS